MIKRTSLVWKKSSLSDEAFKQLWLGEHVDLAKRLQGLLEYVIDFIPNAPEGVPNGIATVRFDSLEALEHAFSDPHLTADLLRTRADFAERVQIVLVEEHCIVRSL